MQEVKGDNKKIAKNTAFLYVRMLFILVISLYMSRVVLRTLGVIDFGINNVVAGFVSMFAFFKSSLSNGIQRFYNYELGKNGVCGMQKVYCTSICIQLLLAIVLLILVETLGIWYLETKMVVPDDRVVAARWVFQCAVIGLIFAMMEIPYSAALMAHEKDFNMDELVNLPENATFISRDEKLLVKGYEPPIHDFTIEKEGQNYIDQFLEEHKLLMFVTYNLNLASEEGLASLNEISTRAKENGYQVIALTASNEETIESFKANFKFNFDFYFCDATTLKTNRRIRAD